MKTIFLAAVIITSSAFAGLVAKADDNKSENRSGLYVEPMLTYEGSSKTKIDWPSPLTSSTGSLTGFGVGARLGFHIDEVFFVAADARYSKPTFKDSSLDTSSDATAYNYGVGVGVQAPVFGLRVWGDYIAGGELDPAADKGFDTKFTGGSGYRVGAGLRFDIVSINLEYQHMKYDKTDVSYSIAGFNPSTSLNDSKLQNDSYILSVAFPIDL